MAQVQVEVPAQNGVTNAANGVVQMVTTSLYVGDLDASINETQLFEMFSQMGQVVSVRVCRDLSSRRSLGYGYVNFSNPQEASRALNMMNFSVVNGKPIRIMYSNRDPSIRKSGTGNIFVKNLDKGIDNKALHETFSTFGNILSCKIATDVSGQSKGYGFVQFDTEEAAQSAIEKLNGMLLNDKQVFVGPFVRKEEREFGAEKVKFNNIYVKNFSETLSEDDLKNIFGEYGAITSVVVMRDGEGKSKGFGFVNFEEPDDAARAVDALNGKKFDDKEWYVGKAQKKAEREMELKGKFEQTVKETVDKNEGLNLYVKNLDDSVTDEKLKELFSEFGTITSCKVMREPSGVSRGSGFVALSTAEEASRAVSDKPTGSFLAEMNGKMIVSKPLYVALAQRKEDRRARLQPGFGYQQQLLPGVRPNFYMPIVQPGQQNQRPGGRRAGAGPVQQNRQPPLVQPQMLPRGRGYHRFPPGRNMPDLSIGGAPGGMLPVPYNMGGVPFRDSSFNQPMSTGALATALANSTPEQQRTLLGENLYPLVDQLEHENAAKVTGMLLEMDQTEVLHLLESPDALKAKVAEAMDVLRNVTQQTQQPQVSSPTDRLAALSLTDNLVS
ncbi:hypothetical protein F8388_017191 [Cannabis sativa]|uniref:Polyadenylate-binding protein n=1 Tax=Cannabis sativa TaxID=3483 RepID=A0A7J6GDG0_CANSA|nr:hypothetical protein F8388_017191 [Cannabis sativa]KAF4401942.1 hypothetical protein G4B88_017454 [Cannabis sativa]